MWWNMMQTADNPEKHQTRGRQRVQWDAIFWKIYGANWVPHIESLQEKDIPRCKDDFVRATFKIMAFKILDDLVKPMKKIKMLAGFRNKGVKILEVA